MKHTSRFLVVLLILPASLLGQAPASSPATTPAASPEAVAVPKVYGLYYQTPNGLVAIVGQAVGSARASNPLATAATFGFKSMKINVEIPGEHAANTTAASPVFYYREPWGTDAVGGSAGDLVLVRMNVKRKSRQVQVGQAGTLGANAGLTTREQVAVVRKQLGPGLYSLMPAEPLKRGEYGFYWFRGYALPGYIYDFAAE